MQIKELETERCILRYFTMDDINEAYKALDSHPEVYKFDPGYERTIEERTLLIKNRIIEYSTSNGLGCLVVVKKVDNKIIGYCGLQGCFTEIEMYEPGPYERSLEIELYYKIHYNYWSQGYALEASKKLIEFAFNELKIKRIVTETDIDNLNSVKLLKRLGMKIILQTRKPDKVYGVLNNIL